MHYQLPPDHPLLTPLVKCFWYTDRVFSADLPRFEVLPDSYVELVFFQGAVCHLQKQDGTQVELHSPFLVGLLDTPLQLFIVGPIRLAAIRFFPWSVFSFFRMQPQINENMDFSQLFALSADGVHGLLARNEPLNALKDLRESLFRFAAKDFRPHQLVAAAGQNILHDAGQAPVGQLAPRLYTTTRTLERAFRRYSGNSAKMLARKVRYERVRDHLWANPDCNMAQVALEYGFSDQAHLCREFKLFSLQTPTAFIREVLACTKNVAFVQDRQEESW